MDQVNLANHRLNCYEIEFESMPITFKWIESKLSDPKKPPKPLKSDQDESSFLYYLLSLPQEFLTTIYMKTMGIKLIYPGSTMMNNLIMSQKMREKRNRLIKDYQGKRCKLLTNDGNTIDSMFIDQRGINVNGAKLVITCEGNMGYYECSSIWCPLTAGYSVLGWNHPGFGSSTGQPFPEAEVNAIDTVIKFALEKLCFNQESIIIYGWSIGGYTSSWAAMSYPFVRGLILDASFDHINSVLSTKIPRISRPFWLSSMKKHFNLNVSEQLDYFPGPVLVIRRTKDIITTDILSDQIMSNRANYIIINLFKRRFPMLMNDTGTALALKCWLSGDTNQQNRIMIDYNVDFVNCQSLLKMFLDKHGRRFPVLIGSELDEKTRISLILFLASKHLLDFDETHTCPLPVRYFIEPWNLFEI
ncbi:phosphatidylserine lipase ABHD16A-like [Panonychus citri]|uniref:phosphatidylserine lipase ABHD16A-like n=1 Tax=Panonychus citri TaxID=50023 RepID=UPI002307182B|nr:phosphatidylserine lipase ABHD16A-like [Panonychus citri]